MLGRRWWSAPPGVNQRSPLHHLPHFLRPNICPSLPRLQTAFGNAASDGWAGCDAPLNTHCRRGQINLRRQNAIFHEALLQGLQQQALHKLIKQRA